MSNNKAGAGPERHVWDLLSAYIDDSLDKATHEEVRGHLEECADCRADYIELRATRHMLRSLPVAPPPRAFTLTEEAVARRPGLLERLLAPRNAPRLATGSVFAFILLVVVLSGNVLAGSNLARVEFAESKVNQTFSRIGSGLSGDLSTNDSSAPQESGNAYMIDQSPGAVPTVQAPAGAEATVLPRAAAARPPASTQPPAGGVGAPAAGAQPEATPAAPAPAQTPGNANADLGFTYAPTTTPGSSTGSTTALGIARGAQKVIVQEAPGSRDQAQPTTGPDVRFSIGLAIALALALLGILLAAGAIIAGRRGVRAPPGE